MSSIPKISSKDIEVDRTRPFHASGSILQADLYEITWQGKPALLKDYAARPWWVRASWAKVMVGREFRALRRLQEMDGIAELYARVGQHGIVMQKLDAARIPRNKDIAPESDFFRLAQKMIDELHERGVAHGDLRRKNIMIDAKGRPYLIDFETAVTAKPGWSGAISRFAFRRIANIDRIKMARMKSEFYPDLLTDEERHLLERLPWGHRLGRFLKKRVYRLKKPHYRRAIRKRIRKKLRQVLSSSENPPG